MKLKPKYISFLLLCISLLIGFLTNTTYDEGDSITHFLISKNVLHHPDNFLNHWGKPVFILLSFPFTTLAGWNGMEIFNILVIFLSAFFAWRTASVLNIPYAFFCLLFCYFAPKNFLIQFSGLTEPLFGLFLVLPAYLWIINKRTLSLLMVSFIPFVRTEGLIIVIVWAVFLLFSNEWKRIYLLATGFFVYSVSGIIASRNFLWFFTENPYAGSENEYGHGNWSHFIESYPYLIGVPFFVLVLSGIAYLVYRLTKPAVIKNNQKKLFEIFIIYGCFAAYFFSHSLFWSQGIFGSFGMIRVLLGLTPFASIIALRGIEFLLIRIKNQPYHKTAAYVLIGICLVIQLIPFKTGSFHYKQDFNLTETQKLEHEVADWLKQSENSAHCIFTSCPYLNLILDKDIFDPAQTQFIKSYAANSKKGDYIIWDNWFAVTESGISYETLASDKSLELQRKFALENRYDMRGNQIEFFIFRKVL